MISTLPAREGIHEKAPAEIVSIAVSTRESFNTMLEQSLGHKRTIGTCIYAAVLCSKLICRFTSAEAIVRGGDGSGDGGLFVNGTGHGHYWVEARVDQLVLVVDITADQFGLPSVIIAPAGETPAQYIVGDQATVNLHVADLLREIEADAREQ